jgi:hypothetical protein
VVAVQIVNAGSWTLGVTLTGATVLPVATVADFEEDGGAAYIGDVFVQYESADIDPDTGACSLTLMDALLADVPDHTDVVVDPPVQWKVAKVLLASAGTEAEWVDADVPSGRLWDDTRLAEGTASGQTVTVRPTHGGGYEVTDIPGSPPLKDTAAWDPDSHPPATPIRHAFEDDPNTLAGGIPPGSLGPGDFPQNVTVAGGAFQHSAEGYRTIGASGASTVHVPTDGRPPRQRGEIEALTVSTTEGAHLGGESEIPAGSTINLGTELGPPSTAPDVTQEWVTDTMVFPFGPWNRRGFGMKDFAEAYCFTTHGLAPPHLVRFLPSTGELLARFQFNDAPTFTFMTDLTYSSLEDAVVALEFDANAREWLVRYYSISGVFDSEFVVPELGTQRNPDPAISCKAIGGDDHIVIARAFELDGTVDLIQYTAGVYDSTVTTAEAYATEQTGYDMRGAAQVDGVVALTFTCNPIYPDGTPLDGLYPNRPLIPMVDVATGAEDGWLVVGTGDPQSYVACYDGDALFLTFVLSATTDLLVQHGDWRQCGGLWVGCSWYKSPAATESMMSPVARVDKLPGSIITASGVAAPAGSAVNRMRLYAGFEVVADTYPGDSAMWDQAISLGPANVIPIQTIKATGTHPLAVATETDGGDPGAITAGGVTLIAGDGTGLIYTLIAAGGGGGGTGGIDIDCGNASATGVEIDCGAA